MDHSDAAAAPSPGDGEDGKSREIEGAAGPPDRAASEAEAPHAWGANAGDEAHAAGEDFDEDRDEESGEAPDHGQNRGSGGLRPLDSGFSDVALFFAAKEANAPPEPPAGRLSTFINYGSSAAFVLAVLGFAFAAGTYFFGGERAGAPDKTASEVAMRESVDRADMLRKTQHMVDEIGALRVNVDALRASVAQAQSGRDQRGLEKSVDALKAKVDSIKADTSGALADLSGKVDRLQRDPGLKQVADRLDRIEKQTAAPTGSISPIVKAATQEQKGVQPKSQPAIDAIRRPQLITSWVVRDVYDGVALVENARGSIEVALGDQIPGAGTVRSIERRGGGWVVITSRGLVDYDHTIR